MDIQNIFPFFVDSTSVLLSLLVFLAVTIAAFGVMITVHARGVVKRRAAGITVSYDENGSSGAFKQSSLKAAKSLLDYTNKHYTSLDADNMKMLRRRLIQAAIFDPSAVSYFFIARVGLATGFGAVLFMVLPMMMRSGSSSFWLLVGGGGVFGYIAPSIYLDKLIAKRQQEYRRGFPDFMDLLVVCADAGLAMEASLERVGRELADSYVSLSANIQMTCLEIRAGRSISEALEHFADRLGLEEVRAFATLIQQSDEFGSSISDALRVYSDDMRHKRLSRAEEKAYSLPAKLTVPMMLCIFPVLFVVILLPVIVRLSLGAY
jgi:tight adherence protein C